MFRLSFSSVLLASLGLSCSVTFGQNLNVTTFAEYLANDADLSTLNAALAASGVNLTGEGSSTVFAPVNAAFAKLDAKLVENLLKPGWSQHLANVLYMHITAVEALSSSQLMDGQEIFTLNTESLFVSIDNETVSINSPNTNNSVVLEANIPVIEGIVHKVDQVLLPPFASTSLLDLAGGEGFTTLTELLKLSGLDNVVGATDLIATVFAPMDDAFKALPDGALDYYRSNIDVLTTLLAGHVIADAVLPTVDMVNGPIANKTVEMTTLTVTIEEIDGTKLYSIDNATISFPDVLANNGIIHGISSVLVVPGAEYPPVTKPTAPSSPTPKAPAAPTAKPPTAPSSDAMVYGYVAALVTSLLGMFVMA